MKRACGTHSVTPSITTKQLFSLFHYVLPFTTVSGVQIQAGKMNAYLKLYLFPPSICLSDNHRIMSPGDSEQFQ